MSSMQDAAVPHPPDISAAVDPLFELLAAFPLPQLLGTTALPDPRGAVCIQTDGSDEGIVNAVTSSARTLMASKSYMALRCTTEDVDDDEEQQDGSNKKNAPQLSPLAQRIHEELLRMENDQLNGISGIRKTETPSKRVRWALNTELHMTLHPRVSVRGDGGGDGEATKKNGGDDNDDNVAAAAATAVKKRVKVPKLETKPDLLHNDDAFEKVVQTQTESYCSLTIADIIEKGMQDTRSLESLLGMLSDASQPFKNIPADRLTSFISSLVVTLPEGSSSHSSEMTITRALMERTLASCACISHPSFEPAFLAEDTIDHLITILAAIIRYIKRRNLSPACDTVNGGTELECMRAMLSCFAIVVSDTRLNVCTHGDMLRLEDLCFQSLFVVTNACEGQDVTNYAAYVMSNALHLYSCLWNRLETQRDVTWERFFPRLPHYDNLSLRLYQLPTGVKTMILTPAVVSAAQSLPLSTGTTSMKIFTERLQHQCRVWSNMFFHHFVIEEREEKKDRDMCSMIFLRFCEDLAHMMGLPEYPVADILLRSLLVAFAQFHFSSSATEASRLLFLDVVFHVSCVVFGPSQQALLQSTLPSSCVLTDAQLQQWHTLTHPGKTQRDAELPLPYDEMRRAIVYMTLSHRLNDPAVDVAAVSLHLRAAHIFTWAIYDGSRFPETVLESLLHTMYVAEGGTSANWDVLHVCSAQLCSASDKSLLSAMAKERLPSWLLSVFQLREEHHTSGLEAAQKRAIQHMTKLTALHFPLLEKIWPIARRCIRDDSARVREAIIPLLLFLVSEGRKDGVLSPRLEENATEAISTLLHLLGDPGVAVVTRAITSLDTLLTDTSFRPLLESSVKGENLLTFTESKLLAMVGPTKETRHQTYVMRLFLRRWVGHEATDMAAHHAHTRVAKEIMRLTMTNMPYPFEVPESSHLVAVLRGMSRMVEEHETSRRTTKNITVDSQELRGVMIGAAKMLWTEHERLMPSPEAAAALAAIHALAMACSQWIEPLLEVLAQTLVNPIAPLSSSSSSQTEGKEALGVRLLHVCRIFRTVLLAPRAPSLSLDPLARTLTTLLSRYVGPHQQQILLSASGALTATITCGSDRLSNHVNKKYLILCYSLMNTYYVRTISLISSLGADVQNVAYTLRFLFLLSEFLRLYPGWKQYHQELTEETAVGGSGVPNQLALGDGICANVYRAVEQVLSHCPGEAQNRTTIIALRVFASLCILQPTVYFYRCEPYLRSALDLSSDLALQIQGLVLIRDFLKDEDARVDHAASINASVPLSSTTASSLSPPLPLHPASTPKKRRKREELHVEITPCVEEQNSGMATWVMQQFHVQILQLCEVNSASARQLAFEVLQLCVEGGLLPPSKYTAALMVLAADPQSETIQQAAVACIHSLSERYADIITANAATSVVKTFDLHDACGVDVLQSAVLADTSLQAGECVHAHVFTSLRKRHRDAFLSSLLRYFYQEGRATQWLRDHAKDDGKSSRNPFPFLGHLTIILAYIPYIQGSDLLHVLDNCRAAVDLVGQSCLDFAETQKSLVQSRKRTTTTTTTTTKGRNGNNDSSDRVNKQNISLELWRCFGVLCISQLRTFLCNEYSLHGAKLRRLAMRRRAGGSHHAATTLTRREPKSANSLEFRRTVASLVQTASPLWEGHASGGGDTVVGDRKHAIEEMCAGLLNVMRETEAEAEAGEKNTSTSTSRGRGKGKGHPSRRKYSTVAEGDEEEEQKQQTRRWQRGSQQKKKQKQRRSRKVEEEDEMSEKVMSSSSSSSSGDRSPSSSTSSDESEYSSSDDDQDVLLR